MGETSERPKKPQRNSSCFRLLQSKNTWADVISKSWLYVDRSYLNGLLKPYLKRFKIIV